MVYSRNRGSRSSRRSNGRRYRRKPALKAVSKEIVLSKPMQKAIARVATKVTKQKMETKVINVPDPDSGLIPTNTLNKPYLAASGLQYLVKDIFRCPQGNKDDTIIGSGNRIGDEVYGVGYELNYFIHLNTKYNFSTLKLTIPFVKLRLIVFSTQTMVNPPVYGTMFDTNYCFNKTWTLQPISWHEGFIKNVYHDELIILRPHDLETVDNVSDPNTQQSYSNCYHFKKYFKFGKRLKYMDDSVTDPTGTSEPIHVALVAEIDDSWSAGGFPPSGTTLFNTTGYARAWIKDA